MAGINRSYTSYHHKTYGTCGYLWQGRYKAQPVEKDNYLLACGRYIERNPVDAKMVAFAQEYPHSSARFYALGITDDLTTISPLYAEMGRTDSERQESYKEFLLDFNREEYSYFNNIEEPVGSTLFINKLIKEHGLYVPRRKGKPRSK
jgi:putative transposase